MNNHPSELQYTKTHEWLRDDGDNVYTIGITDYAQSLLGDIVFVELPELDSEVAQGDELAVVESVKTASDVYAPLAGRVVAANEALTDLPDLLNKDPYGEGWIFRLKVEGEIERSHLLDALHYQEKRGGS